MALKEYNYSTTEKGSSYTINFQGRLSENRLIGEIKEYELFVYLENGDFYVKKEDSEEWVEASTLGLDSVRSFLMGPADILGHIVEIENQRHMLFEEEGNVIHIPYKPDKNALVQALFPGISVNAVTDFDVIIRVNEEGGLSKIEMALHLKMPDATEGKISRSIAIHYGGGPSSIAYPDI